MNPVIVAPTHRPLRLILVTHSAACAARVREVLVGEEVVWTEQIHHALRELAHADADCVLLDLELPDTPGAAGIERLLGGQVPIIALAGPADDATSVIRAGAQDLVAREIDDEAALLRVVRTAVERHRTGERREVERLVREVAAEVRSHPRVRRPAAPVLGVAALIVAFCIQLAVLHHPGGVVLWALFATAAVIAWRATSGRRDDARLLETIVEGSADGVFVKDLEGRYILVNEAASRSRPSRRAAASLTRR